MSIGQIVQQTVGLHDGTLADVLVTCLECHGPLPRYLKPTSTACSNAGPQGLDEPA